MLPLSLSLSLSFFLSLTCTYIHILSSYICIYTLPSGAFTDRRGSNYSNMSTDREFQDECARLNARYAESTKHLDSIQDKYAHTERRYLYV